MITLLRLSLQWCWKYPQYPFRPARFTDFGDVLYRHDPATAEAFLDVIERLIYLVAGFDFWSFAAKSFIRSLQDIAK